MAAEWRTYIPDGRELAVEHAGGRWIAICDGNQATGATAKEAIAAAIGHEGASIGTAERTIDAWVDEHAAQLESEAS